ncbi:hypothetical protein [Streptomyces mobaraensis]|uniref:Uncharacterized protein n=1 Tax=Streptomyces mobaraensis TaxID=35621 RepID=A0A5N5W1M0_STRMB|nr:hypothetical protein [Streptomyces mobaraensis]KAB7835784.1 hypothetical protein FRZ00_26590 [Streptomyces mobaraensis]
MSTDTPGIPPANRGLQVLLAVVASLTVVALVAVGVIAFQRGGDSKNEAGNPAGSTPAAALSDRDLAKLAHDRTKALQAGDEKAFIAPFAGDEQEAQRRVFRNLRRVPMAPGSAFRVVTSGGRLASSLGGPLKAELDVSFDHRIAGVDRAPVSEGYRWTVERKTPSAPLTITKVAGTPREKLLPSDPDTTLAYPAPWDLYDELAVVRAGHVVLMSDITHVGELRSARGALEKAGNDVLAAWQHDGPSDAKVAEGFAVVIEPDAKRGGSLYGTGRQAAHDDGLTVPMDAADNTAERVTAGARLILHDTSTRVGKHEMVHGLLAPLTRKSGAGEGPRSWLVEGIAEHLASTGDDDRGYHSALQHTGFDGRLPDELTFYSKDAQRQAAHYELGRLAVKFLAEKYGARKALEFAAAQYGQPDGLEQQLRDATGLDKTAFEQQWASYVRSTLR